MLDTLIDDLQIVYKAFMNTMHAFIYKGSVNYEYIHGKYMLIEILSLQHLCVCAAFLGEEWRKSEGT